ncbi:MAG TPA: nitroreductase family protein [Bacteroidales bacterium]|jgi:nitroreductase|nr:nitroreductase family protein [Bacteroidales bacterium]HPM86613.1 nitroreductase family protein [Bacteroidales bacterium]
MPLRDLVRKNRSYRRFDESYNIDYKTLEGLVDLARLSASGANRQPLKFLIYNTPDDCARVFPSVVWAAYLKDWDGPAAGERPSAYIIILGDKSVYEVFGVDHGIAAQSIMLGATEAGLGGCMIASIKKELLRNELNIPGHYEILLILALGKPVENVIIDEIKDGDVKYWRDAEKNHHVPKRRLDELIIKL